MMFLERMTRLKHKIANKNKNDESKLVENVGNDSNNNKVANVDLNKNKNKIKEGKQEKDDGSEDIEMIEQNNNILNENSENVIKCKHKEMKEFCLLCDIEASTNESLLTPNDIINDSSNNNNDKNEDLNSKNLNDKQG